MCIHERFAGVHRVAGLLCRKVHGVHEACEGGQRKLSAMLICNGLTGIGCAAEVNAAKYYFSSQLRTLKSKKSSAP